MLSYKYFRQSSEVIFKFVQQSKHAVSYEIPGLASVPCVPLIMTKQRSCFLVDKAATWQCVYPQAGTQSHHRSAPRQPINPAWDNGPLSRPATCPGGAARRPSLPRHLWGRRRAARPGALHHLPYNGSPGGSYIPRSAHKNCRGTVGDGAAALWPPGEPLHRPQVLIGDDIEKEMPTVWLAAQFLAPRRWNLNHQSGWTRANGP